MAAASDKAGQAARRWQLVIHGKSANDEPLREAVAAMRARGIVVSPRVTWEHGDAGRHVDEALREGVDTVVAAGGDGTLSEVAAALARHDGDASTLPSLGLVPLGTANDFATAGGWPRTPAEALALVADVRPTPVDLLRVDTGVETDWCANLVTGGFGTQVTAETDEGLKAVLGGLAYVITGIAKLGRLDTVRARLRGTNFHWDGELIALGIGNGRQAGGGQVLCPDARIDDGLCEVTVIPDLSGEVGSTVATLLTEGRHAALDRIAERTRLPWLEIEAPEPMTLHLDGEPLRSRRFRIECVPRRLRMHLPQNCPLLGAAPGPPGLGTVPQPR